MPIPAHVVSPLPSLRCVVLSWSGRAVVVGSGGVVVKLMCGCRVRWQMGDVMWCDGTHTHTRLNPYPCSRVRVHTGVGVGRGRVTHGLPTSCPSQRENPSQNMCCAWLELLSTLHFTSESPCHWVVLFAFTICLTSGLDRFYLHIYVNPFPSLIVNLSATKIFIFFYNFHFLFYSSTYLVSAVSTYQISLMYIHPK